MASRSFLRRSSSRRVLPRRSVNCPNISRSMALPATASPSMISHCIASIARARDRRRPRKTLRPREATDIFAQHSRKRGFAVPTRPLDKLRVAVCYPAAVRNRAWRDSGAGRGRCQSGRGRSPIPQPWRQNYEGSNGGRGERGSLCELFQRRGGAGSRTRRKSLRGLPRIFAPEELFRIQSRGGVSNGPALVPPPES